MYAKALKSEIAHSVTWLRHVILLRIYDLVDKHILLNIHITDWSVCFSRYFFSLLFRYLVDQVALLDLFGLQS